MAKKIVRGITDVKTITNQDLDTNNVNDLLSDGQYNYIHRKKGKTEEYHNLTDNIKTISSDNTELLSVTNNNKTTNTALLSPKHDAQKEQVIESTRNTITIHHGENGTDEKTTVDTNPQKVLEHDGLSVADGLSVLHSGNKSTIKIEPTFKESGLNLDTLDSGIVRGTGFTSSVTQQPTGSETTFLTLKISENEKFQISVRPSLVQGDKAIIEYRFITGGVSSQWMSAPTSMSEIKSLLAQKQDTLISDSEYITLDHETGENATHIKTAPLKQELQQLHQTKQDTLVAGEGITIQDNVISATGGTTSTIQYFEDTNFRAYGHRVVTSDAAALLTLSFQCYNAAETVLTGELKAQLESYIYLGESISNGAISITYDGTTMKLINSSPSENVTQHATFTFSGNVIN